MRRIPLVRKRDGRLVPFDLRRVADAIFRAAKSVGGEDRFLAEELAGVVGLYLERSHADRVPSVADVEDAVERVLVDTGHAKTAKAFILHRDRRAVARERVRIEEEGGERALPLVAGDRPSGVSRWSKARVAAALVSDAGLEPSEADEVARAVEGRVLSSGLARIPSSVLRALVDSELFARGRVATSSPARVVGVPKDDLAARIAAVPRGGSKADSQAFLSSVGEDVVQAYVLEEVLPPAAAEAHRVGDVHLYDLGHPFAVLSFCPAAAPFVEARMMGDTTPRAGAPRRAGQAVAAALVDGGRRVARSFALEDVNVLLAPFLSRLGEEGVREEVTEILLSPAVSSFPRRGGFRTLEWTLATEVPKRLATRPVPPPAPPGRAYGDYADSVHAVARAVLDASLALRREGFADRLPALTLVVPREPVRDASLRSLVSEALASAALSGEPRFAFDASGLATRGSRWLRIHPDEGVDPLAEHGGDVIVATAGAVNLAAAALRAGGGGGGRAEERMAADLDRTIALLLDAAVVRVEFLVGGASTGSLLPSLGPAAGTDLEAAFHVVEPVGADRAAALLLPGGAAEEKRAMRTRLVRRVCERAIEEAGKRGLFVAIVENPSGEAAERLARVDTARFESAAAWWPEGQTPSYAAARPAGPSSWREASHPAREAGSEAFERVRRRVDTSKPPALSDLFADWERAASDPRVVEYALDPWPRRFLRRSE